LHKFIGRVAVLTQPITAIFFNIKWRRVRGWRFKSVKRFYFGVIGESFDLEYMGIWRQHLLYGDMTISPVWRYCQR